MNEEQLVLETKRDVELGLGDSGHHIMGPWRYFINGVEVTRDDAITIMAVARHKHKEDQNG